jgi:hypothetical protein
MLSKIIFAGLASLAAVSAQASQTVLGASDAFSDAGLFTAVESLSYLSHDEFTTLRHPHFSKHSVRIKKSDFCDPTVK